MNLYEKRGYTFGHCKSRGCPLPKCGCQHIPGTPGSHGNVSSRVAVKRPHWNDKDVGSNPTTSRNEKRTLGDAPTQGSPMGLNRISVEDQRCYSFFSLRNVDLYDYYAACCVPLTPGIAYLAPRRIYAPLTSQSHNYSHTCTCTLIHV